jgi:hypothetical protein
MTRLLLSPSLVPILGYDVVIRALAYAEEWQVRVVRVLDSKMPFIYEVNASVLPHFCAVPSLLRILSSRP